MSLVRAGTRCAVLVGVVAGILSPTPGSGQTVTDVALACTAAGGLSNRCFGAAVAADALQGHLGLLSGLGSEISGTATTLGTRVQGGPRLTFTVRAAAVDVSLPDVRDPAATAETGGSVPTLHAEAAAGIFDGFRLMPTVGGFLSIDAFGRAAFLLLPSSDGFDGGTTAFTAGVRIGIMREGFTVPGVSVSLSRRFIGSVGVGTVADPASLVVDPAVTSIRATVGKDLFAVEWLAGFGWDDFGGDVTVRASDALGAPATALGRLDSSRRIWFAGASMTFAIVLDVSVEAGWAEGGAAVPAYTGDFDPSGGTAFAGLAVRLIL